MNIDMSKPGKVSLEHLTVLVSLGLSLSYQYHLRIGLSGPAVDLHNEIRRGVALSPYRYRVLVPFLAEQLSKVMTLFVGPGHELAMAYRVYQVLAICFTLTALYLYFRTLFTEDRALIGALIAAGTMSLTFQNHYYQPWSLLEPGMVALGILLVKLDKRPLLALFVPVAALNRETAIMIPLAFALASITGNLRSENPDNRRRDVLFALALLIEWGTVFYGLRALLGSTPQIDSMRDLWVTNIEPCNLAVSKGILTVFLGPIWVLAILGYAHSPRFVTRTALLIPFYLVLTFAFSLWWEVRLLMPLYALVIPLALFYVFRDGESSVTAITAQAADATEDGAYTGGSVSPPMRYPSRRQRKKGST